MIVQFLFQFIAVPIIPEYLLRLSHPNSTDLLLYNKIPVSEHSRGKRASFTENKKMVQKKENERQPFIWDDAWEIPSDIDIATDWQKTPLNPFRKSKILRKKLPGKGQMIEEVFGKFENASYNPNFCSI